MLVNIWRIFTLTAQIAFMCQVSLKLTYKCRKKVGFFLFSKENILIDLFAVRWGSLRRSTLRLINFKQRCKLWKLGPHVSESKNWCSQISLAEWMVQTIWKWRLPKQSNVKYEEKNEQRDKCHSSLSYRHSHSHLALSQRAQMTIGQRETVTLSIYALLLWWWWFIFFFDGIKTLCRPF